MKKSINNTENVALVHFYNGILYGKYRKYVWEIYITNQFESGEVSMLVYKESKKTFVDQVISNTIEDRIYEDFYRETGHHTSKNEIRSWQNSMQYVQNVVNHPDVPDDCTIAIEYTLPQTSKRIDVIIAGKNKKYENSMVIIELKQWDKAEATNQDGIVSTFVGGALRNVAHPSYQAWSYAEYLHDFNETVEKDKIGLYPCAYLHNYKNGTVLSSPLYETYVSKAPIFYRHDSLLLRDFIKKYVTYGDTDDLMYRVDYGRIRPSKQLADSLAAMLKGNQEFVLLDQQKVIYEHAIHLLNKAENKNKQVYIIKGGPGTGKSVVAINLLVEVTKRGLLTQYVTKNSAPRAVYASKLTGVMTKTKYNNLFKGSGSYIDTPKDQFDMLIVDEAHRLNEKSGMFNNLGENQIKEIINASKCAVFFIDENQKVTFKDIGRVETIEKYAKLLGASVETTELESQFRCNGSDGYLAWLDNVLQIKDTANYSMDLPDYDFKVVNSPEELHQLIKQKNKLNNKSRMVAGYCWNWNSKKNPSIYDIQIGDYAAQWNLSDDGMQWIIKADSVDQVGCIHTCQGLELDYVGVIIGDDLSYQDGKIQTDPFKRAKTDQSLKGWKKQLKTDEKGTLKKCDEIIKNTYRTLMTRGMKGCYIYCTDKNLEKHFKRMVKSPDIIYKPIEG